MRLYSEGEANIFFEVVKQNEKRIYFFIHKLGIYDQYGDTIGRGCLRCGMLIKHLMLKKVNLLHMLIIK